MINSVMSYFSFRPLTYGYANARVHGMYSNLLSSSQIEELISARSVSILAELLERTAYKKDLVEFSLKFSGEELIELALSKNFAKFSKQILSFTPGSTKLIVDALLSRWDAHNVKTIILAKKQKKTFEQILPYLTLAGTLSKNQLKQLLMSESAEDFYAKLRFTTFGAGLISLPSSHSNGSSVRTMFLSMENDDSALEPLLGILDYYAFKSLSDATRLPFREAQEVEPLLQRYADEKNLSTLLRMVEAGADAQTLLKYLVPGGKVSAAQWKSMFELKDIPKILEKASRKLPLKSAIAKYNKTKKISDVEVELSQDSAKKGLMQFRHSQLSLGTIVGAILLKEQEVANIRKIVRAKSLGLSGEQTHSMMVLVK